MTKVIIKLTSVKEVRDFVSAVSSCGCDIDIAADRYIIDAKSIMGIFSLDLSKPLELRIISDDENEIMDVKSKIEKFIIGE
ncbi:MAG: HPr family phosphocarrier protein [Oscillospiraceae bacterium]